MTDDVVKLNNEEKEVLQYMAQSGFVFVEDSQGDFYIILPDGTETDWSDSDQIAMMDDGTRTYFATNCDDFPGMKAGVVYALGAAMPTGAEDADEDDADGEGEGETETEEESAELEADDDDADVADAPDPEA
jgi:hypothetical protein